MFSFATKVNAEKQISLSPSSFQLCTENLKCTDTHMFQLCADRGNTRSGVKSATVGMLCLLKDFTKKEQGTKLFSTPNLLLFFMTSSGG